MFNLLLALITGLVIGWNFHSFFMQLTPPNILKNDFNFSQKSKEEIVVPSITPPQQIIQEIEEIKQNIEIVKKSIPKEKELVKEKNISIPSTKKIDTFYGFLHNDLFSEAMTLYVDASKVKLLHYQATLLKYFETKSENEPQKAIEQMLEFQELEPAHRKINMEILHEIEDNDHKEQANMLFKLIKNKIDKKQKYEHQISLKKIDEHFTIEVAINNHPLTLLLDTGATLTMVNEEKLSSNLTLIKENIVLNTAGGKINAQLQEADTFSVGEIELKNFEVVSSTFEQKDADGLLGMNFFKEFKFKIDQEKGILYLSRKE